MSGEVVIASNPKAFIGDGERDDIDDDDDDSGEKEEPSEACGVGRAKG